MRNPTIKGRWHTPHGQFSGQWRQNPWINATSSGSQARLRAPDIDAQDRQQKAAIRIWEDEGGSIRTDGNVLR
jgi:hypothetical protein